jgi:hypothetical protein
MSTEQEQVRAWFSSLPPQDRADWLEVRQTGAGLIPTLLQTLPGERRPGCAGAWVLGPVDPSWLTNQTRNPAYVLAEEFGHFLAAEYDRWYRTE